MWRPPLEGLQVGASAQALRLDFEFTPTPEQQAAYEMAGQLPADYAGVITAKIPVQLWVASVEYQREHLALAAEYTRWYVKYETNLLLPQTKIVKEGGYLMASYQVTPWFTPGVYYSALFPNTNAKYPAGADQHPRSSFQHDVAATLRYDITANWLVKLEGHYMHGTAGLSSALNQMQPLDSLEKDWGVLLVKTTGYF
jgi:predicted porin